MPKTMVEVRVEKNIKDGSFKGYVVKIDSEIIDVQDNIGLLGTSLALKLEEIGDRDDCGFILVDAICKKTFSYGIRILSSFEPGEKGLEIIPLQKPPKPWSINKRFYNWFTGRSKVKD